MPFEVHFIISLKAGKLRKKTKHKMNLNTSTPTATDSEASGEQQTYVFDPVGCIRNTSPTDNNLIVISHNNKQLLDQSIYDLWCNATYRGATSSGYRFCEEAVRHCKMNKERSIDVYSTEDDAKEPPPHPNVLVTSHTNKLPAKHQGRVLYSHSVLSGVDSRFDELRICMEAAFTHVDHRPSDVCGIVVLTDQRCSAHEFARYGAFLSEATLVKRCQGMPVYVLCCESVLMRLPVGRSLLMTKRYEAQWCSLVPVCGEATVHTSGLKWNLRGEQMKFGGLISTSNELVRGENVEVHTDRPLMWSMAVKY